MCEKDIIDLDPKHIEDRVWEVNTPDGRREVIATAVNFEPCFGYEAEGRRMVIRVPGSIKITGLGQSPSSLWRDVKEKSTNENRRFS